MEERALFFETLSSGSLRCLLCRRNCVIPQGKSGFCRVRENREGALNLRTYGRVASLAVSPIEKKPLYHYYPASLWLSVGSLGCNFRCPGCQNWELAHASVERETNRTKFVSPEELVQRALSSRCLGISFTYNEPTLWLEYTLNVFRLARKEGLLTNYVTNGYMSPQALQILGPLLHSFRVDVKAFFPSTFRRIANRDDPQGVLENAEKAQRDWGMHVEVVTNVIPGFNDSMEELESIGGWILDVLGPDTPWHLTRFFPQYRLSHLPPTSVFLLEEVRQRGLEKGLRFVYLGNLPTHPGENTLCFRCGETLVFREGFRVKKVLIRDGRCPFCQESVAGKFS